MILVFVDGRLHGALISYTDEELFYKAVWLVWKVFMISSLIPVEFRDICVK
jgi:hypothetical protein